MRRPREAELARRFDAAWDLLAGTRPTAVNLRWASTRAAGSGAPRCRAGAEPGEPRSPSGGALQADDLAATSAWASTEPPSSPPATAR
jgi:methylthioribose-1-phosphate isomerase